MLLPPLQDPDQQGQENLPQHLHLPPGAEGKDYS